MVRHAFTMIELIFALVIMGITFLTLPTILLRNADSVENNLIQESIFLAASKLSQVLSFNWDQNSAETGVNTLETADVITVSNGDNLLDRNFSDFRIGHFPQAKRRRMTPSSAIRSATAIGSGGGVMDDIDDFDNLNNYTLVGAGSGSGYKKSYRADVQVTYVDDASFAGAPVNTYSSNPLNFIFTTASAGDNAANSTNLKMIEVSIDQNNSDGWQQTLLLRAYVANIGETDYHYRRY